MTNVLIRKGNLDTQRVCEHTEEGPYENAVRRWKSTGQGEGASGEAKPANTLTLDF